MVEWIVSSYRFSETSLARPLSAHDGVVASPPLLPAPTLGVLELRQLRKLTRVLRLFRRPRGIDRSKSSTR